MAQVPVIICLDEPQNETRIRGVLLCCKVPRSKPDNLILRNITGTIPSSDRPDRWQKRSTNDILANEVLLGGATALEFLLSHQPRSPLSDQLLDVQLLCYGIAVWDVCYRYPWGDGAAAPCQCDRCSECLECMSIGDSWSSRKQN